MLGKIFIISISILIVCIGSKAGEAKYEDLISLSKSSLDLSLPDDAGYFALRCSALSAAQFRVLGSDPQSRQVVKELHERFFTMSVRSYLEKDNKNEQTLLNQLASKVLTYTNLYSDIIETTFQDSGEYFYGNPLIEEDTLACSSAAQQILDK